MKPWMRRGAYAVAVLPAFTDWIDAGHWPSSLQEYVTEVILGAVLAAGVWMLNRDAERLRRLADTDALTGLGNRRRFLEDVEAAVRRGGPLVLLYVDVDRFKEINDARGHAAGDEVLRRVARRLEGAVRRDRDACYRVGGDEFTVLLPGVAPGDVDGLAARLEVLGGDDPTLSVGRVERGPGETAESLVRRGDLAMYERKRRPRENDLPIRFRG